MSNTSQRKFLTRIIRNKEHPSQLIKDIMEYSKAKGIIGNSKELSEIEETIEDVETGLENYVKKHIY